MKPLQPPHHVALKHAKVVHDQGQKYKIPTLQMALAMKLAPMYRKLADKVQDAHDSTCQTASG